jgi:O-antigen ligase
MVNFLNISLALGITLTTATQLRLPGLPLGIGEGILTLWMIVIIWKIIASNYCLINPIFRVFALFWLAVSICLNLGLLIAFYLDVVALDFAYNAIALAFSCAFSLLFSLYLVEIKYVNQIILWLSSFTVISQLLILLFPNLLPGVQPWYGGIRFSGWAENPNQIGILLSIIPFLILHLILHANQKKITNIWCKLLLICIIIIGILTDSDALRTAWLLGLFILVFLQSNTWCIKLLSKNRSSHEAFIYINILRLFLLMIMITTIFLSFQQEQDLISDVYNKDSQGSIRFTLWIHGLNAISHSPLFGLGPGFFSGVSRPFLNFEAHNTFIDWTGSVGIVGLGFYLYLLTWIAKNAWDKKLLILFVAVISLVGFSNFHYVLRQPIFWFYLLSISCLTDQTSKPRSQSYKISNKTVNSRRINV